MLTAYVQSILIDNSSFSSLYQQTPEGHWEKVRDRHATTRHHNMSSTEATGPNKPIAVAPHSQEINEIIQDHPNLLVDAAQADELEHELSFKQAFHKYYRAALWSMFLSTALIMEGYDMGSVCLAVFVVLVSRPYTSDWCFLRSARL